MIREITIFQTKMSGYSYDTPRIIKKTFTLEDKDKLEIKKDGYIEITLVDACVSGHNGDYYDDHESGYQTFKQAKKSLITQVKENFKKLNEQIKNIKEPK